ncbi:hypothetical protein DFP72DRAFT_912835, partial [Ephemerocybe angulata]
TRRRCGRNLTDWAWASISQRKAALTASWLFAITAAMISSFLSSLISPSKTSPVSSINPNPVGSEHSPSGAGEETRPAMREPEAIHWAENRAKEDPAHPPPRVIAEDPEQPPLENPTVRATLEPSVSLTDAHGEPMLLQHPPDGRARQVKNAPTQPVDEKARRSFAKMGVRDVRRRAIGKKVWNIIIGKVALRAGKLAVEPVYIQCCWG